MTVSCPHCGKAVFTPVTGLTRRQRDALVFIQDYANEFGISPSFDEICQALGLRSKSGVHRIVKSLEERGVILRRFGLHRAIEVRQ